VVVVSTGTVVVSGGIVVVSGGIVVVSAGTVVLVGSPGGVVVETGVVVVVSGGRVVVVSGGSVVVSGGRVVVVSGGNVVGGKRMSRVTGGHISAAATCLVWATTNHRPVIRVDAINTAAVRLPYIEQTLHAAPRFGTGSDTGTLVRP
jgi:hypothetical protein